MRNKIFWDQLADRAARSKVLPFASFTPIAVVGSGRRVRDIIQYATHTSPALSCNISVSSRLGWCTTAMERWVVMLHTSSANSRTSLGADIESISISICSDNF